MTEGAQPLSTPAGVPEDGLARLLAAGRARGHLTEDDLMGILETVELSPQLIDALVARVEAEGIELRNEPVVIDEDVDVITEDEEQGSPAVQVVDAAPADGASAPAREATEPPPGVGAAPERAADEKQEALSGNGSPAAAVREAGPRPVPAMDRPMEDDAIGGAGADPVRTYLKEIGKVRLLTAEAEVNLARRIDAGIESGQRLEGFESAYGPDGVPFADRRREERFATRDDADGGGDLLGRGVLEHEAARACAERVIDVAVEPERRQYQYTRRGPFLNDAARRLDPVEHGHADVHQHDVGP